MKEFRRWASQHTYTVAAIFGIVGFLIGQSVVAVDMLYPLFPLNEANLTTLLSTSVQVVTGLYGITLTGYIFFSGQLDQQADRDKNLVSIVNALKVRYNKLILILTLLCAVCFCAGMFWLVYDYGPTLPPICRAFVLETLMLLASCALFNLYFVCDVADPDKFIRTSNVYKARLDGASSSRGDAQEFMDNCDRIRSLLSDLIPHDAGSLIAGHHARSRLTPQLLQRIDKLMTYSSFLAYSSDLTVSEEMCLLSREVLQELESASAPKRAPRR